MSQRQNLVIGKNVQWPWGFSCSHYKDLWSPPPFQKLMVVRNFITLMAHRINLIYLLLFFEEGGKVKWMIFWEQWLVNEVGPSTPLSPSPGECNSDQHWTVRLNNLGKHDVNDNASLHPAKLSLKLSPSWRNSGKRSNHLRTQATFPPRMLLP